MTALADLFGFKTKKAETPKPSPSVPSPVDADAKARDELRRKRLISQRTGGKTLLSSEYGQGTQAKNLLGE